MEYLDKWPKSDIPGNLEEITFKKTGVNKSQTEKFIKATSKWRTDAAKVKTEVDCETEDATVHT